MEPAMALCAGVAALTLSIGAIRTVGAAGRRNVAIRIPIPTRSLATILMVTGLVSVLSRPKPASATVAPPIVRLTDETPEEQPPAAVLDAEPAVYVVEAGDCLWRIARTVLTERNGSDPSNGDVARFWPVIYEANRSLIGDNPNLIFPGQELVIPEG